jgi:hypothetical protein
VDLATLLQVQRAGIAAQLAVLDGADLTATGQSSGEVPGVRSQLLAEVPTSHLLQAAMLRRSGGRPLAALVDQRHHDVTRLLVQRIVGALPNWGTRCRR